MKKIKLHVTLSDFKKIIYRKFEIIDDLDMITFCESIICSFNGDLSHLYELNGKNFEFYFSGDDYELTFNKFKYGNPNKRIQLLELCKGDKIKLTYDFGDNWKFSITVSSVEEIEKDNELPLFKVTSGKGLGILEDCGGMWGLEDYVYNAKNKEKNSNEENYNEYDIDIFEFDLKEQEKYTQYRN